MKNFGVRLKELRKEKGLSQKALAQQLGYNQSMICFWENGVNEPTESAIRKTAIFFNVSADYLLGLTDEY
ncbi:MAG: helix-turn-helix transcriptional regulator [Clostridiales bacterium]|nr:helix-turn-helix transcriptional regulator [Clostridiales bacterium]